MKIINKEGKLIPIEEMNINRYILNEYIGTYDHSDNLLRRLKYLACGIQIYSSNRLPDYLFVEFHKRKQAGIIIAVNVLIAFFVILGFVLFFVLRAYFATVMVLAGAYLIKMFLYDRNIRNNFLHTSRVLEDPKFLAILKKTSLDDEASFKILEEKLLYGELLINDDFRMEQPVKNQMSDHIAISETRKHTVDKEPSDNIPGDEIFEVITDKQIYLTTSFEEELILISKQKNQFNELAMLDVINFFYMMCCPLLKDKVPQMTQNDFLSFLRMAFLGAPKVQNLTFKYAKQKRKYVRAIFYEFLEKSQFEVGESSSRVREKYAALIFDHFIGYTKENVMDNFKEEKDWLINIVNNNKHKIPIVQELPN